jgi:hypothetical protein
VAELTRDERDELVRRAISMEDARFPPPGSPPISDDDYHQASETFYLSVGAYFDGLPRRVMSVCPFCGELLERAFDPWGLDGPWWGEGSLCKYSEPPACDHFRVLLGALQLADDAVPARVVMKSFPGPDVPFVVPRLLDLGLVAVVGALTMDRGGPAYPIAYFSEAPVDPGLLHQPWRRTTMWYERDGREVWSARNDPWDFDLAPHVAAGKVVWVLLDEQPPRVHRAADGESCPFVGLPGQREPQVVADGARSFMPPPDGTPLNPFDEDGGA